MSFQATVRPNIRPCRAGVSPGVLSKRLAVAFSGTPSLPSVRYPLPNFQEPNTNSARPAFQSQTKRPFSCSHHPQEQQHKAQSTTGTTPSNLLTSVPYSALTVGIPRETFPNERRVAVTPQNTALLLKKGFSRVLVERGAGEAAKFNDSAYTDAGATLVDRGAVWADSDVLLKVRAPSTDPANDEVKNLREGGTLISFLYPAQNKALVDALAARRTTSFAMDMIPRISRAQVFDALRFVQLFFLSEYMTLIRHVCCAAPWQILPDTRRFSKRRTTLGVSSLGKSLQLGKYSLVDLLCCANLRCLARYSSSFMAPEMAAKIL